MNHQATRQFWRLYDALPGETRRLADKCFDLLKEDSRHPSLHLKEVGRFWSVRVGLRYCALAVRENDELTWFWIGNHAEYDRLIKRRR